LDQSIIATVEKPPADRDRLDRCTPFGFWSTVQRCKSPGPPRPTDTAEPSALSLFYPVSFPTYSLPNPSFDLLLCSPVNSHDSNSGFAPSDFYFFFGFLPDSSISHALHRRIPARTPNNPGNTAAFRRAVKEDKHPESSAKQRKQHHNGIFGQQQHTLG